MRKNLHQLSLPRARLSEIEKRLVEAIVHAQESYHVFTLSKKKPVYGLISGEHYPSHEEDVAMYRSIAVLADILNYCCEGKKKPLTRREYHEALLFCAGRFHPSLTHNWDHYFLKVCREHSIPMSKALERHVLDQQPLPAPHIEKPPEKRVFSGQVKRKLGSTVTYLSSKEIVKRTPKNFWGKFKGLIRRKLRKPKLRKPKPRKPR